ncbi:MAG: hypothetical protein HY289_16240 [Planctomycetes bacterium]|nr:hypothetical protein [Planctomycetota bacterium]
MPQAIRLFAFACIAFATVTARAYAQDEAKKAVRELPKWSTTRVRFEMDGKPWKEVLPWFAAQTKMKLVSPYPLPAGHFKYKHPKGPAPELSLLEIMDILNEQLQHRHRTTLVRNDEEIVLVHADDRFVPPRIELHDLKNRANTEVVVVTLKIKDGQNPEEVALEVKRMLGNFGHVTAVKNHLVLRSDVASLRRAIPILTPMFFDPPELPNWSTTRVRFDMDGKPWKEVLTWFAGQAQMNIRSLLFWRSLDGIFRYAPPKNSPRELPLTDIFDIINERLQEEHGLRLIRSEDSLALTTYNDFPGGPRPPRVELRDLKDRGKTEIVEVLVRVKQFQNDEEVAVEVKRMLGSFGHAVAIRNHVLIVTDVASLRRVLPYFVDMPATPPEAAQFVSPPCPAAACCGSAPRCRPIIRFRLFRR